MSRMHAWISRYCACSTLEQRYCRGDGRYIILTLRCDSEQRVWRSEVKQLRGLRERLSRGRVPFCLRTAVLGVGGRQNGSSAKYGVIAKPESAVTWRRTRSSSQNRCLVACIAIIRLRPHWYVFAHHRRRGACAQRANYCRAHCHGRVCGVCRDDDCRLCSTRFRRSRSLAPRLESFWLEWLEGRCETATEPRPQRRGGYR